MEYCPYCSNPISEDASICPHCKKNLDLSLLDDLYDSRDTSHISKTALRRIWYKEHRHIVLPIIFFIIGVAAGAAGIYGFARLQFQNERKDLQSRITMLQEQVKQNKDAANQAQSGFEERLKEKDKIIGLLTEQKKLMGHVMSFTRRLARNSTISLADQGQIDYFVRNIRYLSTQFEKKQEELKKLNADKGISPNLNTIPQFLE